MTFTHGDLRSDGSVKMQGVFDMNGNAIQNVSLPHTKSITVESPTNAENLGIFFTSRAITLVQVRAVLRGGTTPSITYQIKHDTDRSAAGSNGTTSAAVTSTTTGTDATLSDSTVPADSWVWLVTTAASGSPDGMTVFLDFTDD